MERMKLKKKIDYLLFAHAVFAAVAGLLAFIAPHVFEWFMVIIGRATMHLLKAVPQNFLFPILDPV
jgi:hypothetical protein